MKKLRNLLRVISSCFLACTFFFAGCDLLNLNPPDETPEPTVTKIVLSETEIEMLAGDNYEIVATAYNEAEKVENATLKWSSSDTNVASVVNGKIIAISGGTATVSVTYGEITESVNVFVAKLIKAKDVNTFSEEFINIYGRSYITDNKLNLDQCANGVELAIIGDSLSADITSTTSDSTTESYIRVYVDGDEEGKRIQIADGTNTYKLADGLANGYHKIRLVKATEMLHSSWKVSNFSATAFATLPEKSDLKIEFIGDSITAGNANLGSSGDDWSVGNSDSAKTYAYFTAQRLNADYSIVAMSGICVKAYHWVKNINMSTLYAYVSNINTQAYSFDFKPDVVVLNLGTNDANYMGKAEGSGYSSQFPSDYKAFLTYLRQKNPNAYIICLYGMMGTNATVNVGIQSALTNLNDSKIVYNPFAFEANTSGGAYHPSLSAQQTWGEALATYIKSLNIN